MKKLNKLQINSEKLMKNEELVTLRGGYDPWVGTCCECIYSDGSKYYFDTNVVEECLGACVPMGASANFVC